MCRSYTRGSALSRLLTALFAAFVMPETRDKTLEQVVAELEARLEAARGVNAQDPAAARKMCSCC